MQKIADLKNYLSQKFFERESVVEGLLVGLLARQHVLLIGPAGTGKSAIVMEMAKAFEGIQYFQWLLTRFSTPEELFGPVSLKELEQGIYKRNTANKLPEAHLGFVDEVFKANSAILNSLLTLMNERLFYNNGYPIKTPLISLIGASNEYPEEGEGLEAMFDRFLLRFEVGYVKERDSFVSMLKGSEPLSPEKISLSELQEQQFLCSLVSIGEEIYETLFEIKKELGDEGIHPSDRRFKQSLSLLQAKAHMEGRTEVIREDLIILANVLWESPDQRNTAMEIVEKNSFDTVTRRIKEMNAELNEIMQRFYDDPNVDLGLETTEKLKNLLEEAKKILNGNPHKKEEITDLINKVKRSQQDAVDKVLEV
ncbi:AAA family ATPase [Thermicanus aegyptius]|uniref:AAA family ATPase n=1 Tax=Thermicanus aegyptius TaxID=94009 RepID=UPI0004210D63|nr:AAA family ATPase [Thermicanus aegyptius]